MIFFQWQEKKYSQPSHNDLSVPQISQALFILEVSTLIVSFFSLYSSHKCLFVSILLIFHILDQMSDVSISDNGTTIYPVMQTKNLGGYVSIFPVPPYAMHQPVLVILPLNFTWNLTMSHHVHC